MAKLIRKGGKGSGNWGHAGRPGKVGGSAPRDGVYQQGELFNTEEYGGRFVDDAAERHRRLSRAGFSDDVIRDLNPDIPLWLLEHWYEPYTDAASYNSAYEEYSGQAAFEKFVKSAGSLGNFLKFAEWDSDGWNTDGLTDEYFAEVKELADAFGIDIPEAADYLGLLGHGYGYYTYFDSPDEVAEYYKAGVRDEDAIAELYNYGVPVEDVIFNLKRGAANDDFEELSEHIYPHERAGFTPSAENIGVVGTPPSNTKTERDTNSLLEIENQKLMDKETPASDVAAKTIYPQLSIATKQSAKDFILAWMGSSNDDASSRYLQVAATRLFHATLGTNLSAYQASFIGWVPNDDDDKLQEAKDVLSVSYANAQRYLKDHDIKKVRLYRGVRLDKHYAEGVKEADVMSFDEGALESWSLEPDTARGFAEGVDPNEVGLVLTADVPAERIAGLSFNGLGTPSEDEVVVLGASTDDQYYVDKRFEPFDPQKEINNG